MSNQCNYYKSDGFRCKGYAVRESEYCFFHVDNGARARLAGARGGKKNKALRSRRHLKSALNIRSVREIISLLEGSINQVLEGYLDTRIANSIGYLSNILIKAIEQGKPDDLVQSSLKKDDIYVRLSLDHLEDDNGQDFKTPLQAI